MARSAKRAGKRSQLRIIGGQWRGRKLSFVPADGLRPTGDRTRETLFNWLAPYLQGARCADLFAGSGALGLEALSRGAAHCDFVDTSRAALAQIGDLLAQLEAGQRAHCHAMPAEAFLQGARQPFDIVFIDPPFGRELAAPVCTLLEQRQLLAAHALVYVEASSAEPCPAVPQQWQAHREKSSGGVTYRLFRAGQD